MITRGLSVPGDIKFLAALFAFDAGWDLTLLATGHSDRLVYVLPRHIIGKALERVVPVGLCFIFFTLEGDARLVAITVFVIWAAASNLTAARPVAAAERPELVPVETRT